MRAAITDDLIKKLKGKTCEVWDTKLPGLVLRMRESGRHSYVVQYARGKKETLGREDVLKPNEARALAQQVLGDVAHGKDPQSERRKRRAGTVREFLDDQYAAWATANRKSGAITVARVLGFPDSIIKRPLAELSAWQLEQWRTARRKDGIQDSTINRDLDSLRSVLSKAVEWGVLSEHPMRQVRRAKIDVIGRIRYLSEPEEMRLRAALTARDDTRREARQRFNAWRKERGYRLTADYGTYTDHLTPIVLLALNTGLRRGELLQLRWPDVDLMAARLTVRGASAKSALTRHIPLNSEAVAVLKTWRQCVEIENGDIEADAVVFAGPDGDPMFSLKTAWPGIAKAANLKAFVFHDLRHSFASKLVQMGVDLNTVRELLGHADIRMTLRYSHLAPEHKAAAVAKLVRA